MHSRDAKGEQKTKVLVHDSRRKQMLWVIAAECYSDAKIQTAFVRGPVYYLFKFYSLSIKLSPEGASILQYFVSYNVNRM